MKTFIVVVLMGIVFSQQAQGVLKLEDSVKNTHLGRVFLKMAEMRTKAQQFDFSQLFAALSDLDEEIRSRKADEQQSLNHDFVQYNSDLTFFSQQITQFENDIATHEVDISDFTETRDGLQTQLQEKSGELAQVQKLKDDLQKQVDAEAKKFESEQTQYVNAIGAVDQALELLGSLRDGAFIQKKDSTAKTLEKSLSELTHRRVMYQPLVNALTQIMDFNSSEGTSKVQKLLQNLRDSLAKSQIELANAYNSELAINSANLDKYKLRLSNLTDIILPAIQAEIKTSDAAIQTKSNLLKDANTNLAAAKSNLDGTNTRWVQRQQQNSKLIDEYDNQIALFPKIEDALLKAGIRK